MAVLQYDPKNITVIIGGKIIRGYNEATFCKVERNEDMYNLVVGVDGIGSRAKSNNKSGKVTLGLHQTSRSNDDLSALALADELTGAGAVPMLIRDSGGRTLISAATAWITKQADAEYQKTISDRTWTIESDSIDIFNGGN